jgi:N-acetylmuramoyl-L-alanine amidase
MLSVENIKLNKLVLWALAIVILMLSSCQNSQIHKQDLLPPSSARIPTILLDAGHGGKDHGAVNVKLKILEKQLSLKTVQLIKSGLQSKGYLVKLLRQKDEYLSLESRVKLANSYANSLLVSIHFNSAPNRQAEGIEVFYFSGSQLKQPLLRRDILSKKLATFILKNSISKTQAGSRGVKEANFRIIKMTKMPSCLFEGGFITHVKEAKKLSRASYLNQLAEGVVNGIDEYCKSYP